MCGRFTLTTPAEILAQAFGLEVTPELSPRYNIAPSQPVAVVRSATAGSARELGMAQWGLVPAWPGKPWTRGALINARSETVARAPAFRTAFARRRCLIPADGFYEWRSPSQGRAKQPFYIRLEDGRPFAFAGLWEPGVGGTDLDTCAILTTEPNDVVRAVHDRMPMILGSSDYGRWLADSPPSPSQLGQLRAPFVAEPMVAHPVGGIVNNPSNDVASCIEPTELPRTLF